LNSTNWHLFEGLSRFFGGLYLVIGAFFGKTLAVFVPAYLVTLLESHLRLEKKTFFPNDSVVLETSNTSVLQGLESLCNKCKGN